MKTCHFKILNDEKISKKWFLKIRWFGISFDIEEPKKLKTQTRD
jgi:hypothetical protein